jgi:type VI secretion system protein ImpC
MPERSGIEFEFEFAQPQTQPVYRATGDGPMRILLLGDFSGRSNRGVLGHGDDLAARPTVLVDVDNLDGVLNGYAPRLRLPSDVPEGPVTEIEFRRLDDFHPDHLYDTLGLFKAFREMRLRMTDPATFAEETAALRSGARETPATADDTTEDDTATVERLLGRKPADRPQARARTGAGAVGIERFIRSVVEPYIVPDTAAQQAHLVAAVDQATAEQMASLLHRPAFQELEAAWRQVSWLVSGLETGEDLKLYLLDVTKEELAADIGGAGGDLEGSGLYRLLVEKGLQTPGGQAWSVLAGHFAFGTAEEDVTLLAALGTIASRAGGPFLAAARPEVVGCESLDRVSDPTGWSALAPEEETRWQALRRHPSASWVGLALPRVLLRLPYGKRTDEVDRFDFEELPPGAKHEDYLWGNPAAACALLIGRAFTERGWSMEPGDLLDLDDLPLHVFEEEGESRIKPCAEALISERGGDAILERGVMPVLSYRDRNMARVLRFQSVADPPAALSGPWG